VTIPEMVPVSVCASADDESKASVASTATTRLMYSQQFPEKNFVSEPTTATFYLFRVGSLTGAGLQASA